MTCYTQARENLTFRLIDLYSREAHEAIQQEAKGASLCIAVGMHLCGALSPRLIDLALAADEVGCSQRRNSPPPLTCASSTGQIKLSLDPAQLDPAPYHRIL